MNKDDIIRHEFLIIFFVSPPTIFLHFFLPFNQKKSQHTHTIHSIRFEIYFVEWKKIFFLLTGASIIGVCVCDKGE